MNVWFAILCCVVVYYMLHILHYNTVYVILLHYISSHCILFLPFNVTFYYIISYYMILCFVVLHYIQ